MLGRLVLQSAVMLCLVQAALSGGYSAAYGASSGPGPQPDGIRPQNGGGVGALLMPSKGVGRTLGQQNGYAGYPTKGVGYGAAAGVTKGIKGYGVKAGPVNGQQMNGYGAQAGGYGGQRTKGNVNNAAAAPQYGPGTKGNGQIVAVFPNGSEAKFNGYGVVSGPTNEHQIKGYGAQAGGQGTKGNGNNAAAAAQYTKGIGYGGQAGGFGGQRTKGYGAQAGGFVGQRTKGNGYGVVSGPTNGQQTKGYGAQMGGFGGQRTKGMIAGPSSSNGAQPHGQGGDGSKPMKGYGRPLSGTGMVMGPFRGVGVPQFARNQEKAYNGNNGYRAQNMGGTRGGYGAAGLGLGPRYGNGGLKGPLPGYGVLNGQNVKSKGYAGVRAPSGNGAVQSGYGNPSAAAAKPAKQGYGNPKGSAVRSQLGYVNGAAPNGYGSKPKGYEAAAGAGPIKGYGSQTNGHGVGTGAALGGFGPNGYGMLHGKGQAVRGADLSTGTSLKGGVLSSQHQVQDVAPQQLLTLGEVLVAPAPTAGVIGLVTNEKYQKLLLPKDKSYKQMPLIPMPTPEAALPDVRNPNAQIGSAPVALQSPAPEPAGFVTGGAVPERSAAEADVDLGFDSTTEGGADPDSTEPIKTRAGSETAAAKTENSTPEETLSLSEAAAEEESTKMSGPGVKGLPAGETEYPGVLVSKNQGAKPTKPECGATGQWMGIPRSGNGGSTGAYVNGGGVKANKPGYQTFPGFISRFGAGLGYPYGGKMTQPGSVNGYNAGGRPEYASLGQSLPAADGKSGGTKLLPYNGAPVVAAGIDGMSQSEPQPAGLHPSVMAGLPFGGMSSEMSNTKYGVGGLQFGQQPISLGLNGAGQYGGLGASVGGAPVNGKYGYGGFSNGGQLLPGTNGNIPGKYGYGGYPYEGQQPGLTPEAKSAGQYDLRSPYHSESVGQNGKLKGKYGGAQVPYGGQVLGLGGDVKSGKYDKQGAYQSQPLGSASEGTAGLIYEPQPLVSDSAGKPYVKGEVPTSAAEGKGMPINKYENVGYINGQVQPNVVAFAAPPTPSPTSYSSLRGDSFTAEEVTREGVQDLLSPDDTGSLLESATASEMQGEIHVTEHPDDLELPRQIHIQQHLKLHFHPQGGKKYDLNGFFGNDHQG